MNKFSNVNRFVFALFFMMFSGFAAAGGGLGSATNALANVKTWLFGFVGIAALVYMLYCIAMALMERKSWGDVGMALVYCSLAGGAVVGGTWALELFQ
ncbi:conjugal transfer protein [Salmonella enterica subsp. salamae]|nr:conjugal transfer protein [Salmonella enterica subsp. salamae]